MYRPVGAALLLALSLAFVSVFAFAQEHQRPDAPRPIEAGVSLWAEELTSMEICDALLEGTTGPQARRVARRNNGKGIRGIEAALAR